jgi:ferredoxin
MGFACEARSSEIFDKMDESIKELSKAKMSPLDATMDKDAEIELLKERLSSLVLWKGKE